MILNSIGLGITTYLGAYGANLANINSGHCKLWVSGLVGSTPRLPPAKIPCVLKGRSSIGGPDAALFVLFLIAEHLALTMN